jgi:O-acetylhomoserine/O-acetylserine sulfhydrylase-like pyridoxal-dependent enzyme
MHKHMQMHKKIAKTHDHHAHREKMVHPGFKAVQHKIAKKYGMKAAGAILAHATRHASAAAKKANPHLHKVKG